MRRHLGLVVRILLAAAGVTYIALNLEWSDRVLLPAGTMVDGSALTESVKAPVLEQRDGAYVVARPDVNDPGEVLENKTFVVPEATVDAGENSPSFQPSVVTMLREANLGLLLAGLGLWGLVFPLQTYRWWSLMRCQGLHTSMHRTFRLTMVGTFFNICMPGATGGDVMKAYYAAKGGSQRATAVVSVVIDRAVGLVALVILGGLVGLTRLDDPRVANMTGAVWLGLLALAVMAGVYFSPVRRLVGFHLLLRALPGKDLLRKADRAAKAYGRSWGTVLVALLISILVHVLITLSISMAGYALGVEHDLGFMMATLPVVLLVQAVPLFPMGLGIADAAAVNLLVGPAASRTQVLGLMLVQRLYMIAYAMLGSIVLIRGDIRLQSGPTVGAELDTPDPDTGPAAEPPAPAATV